MEIGQNRSVPGMRVASEIKIGISGLVAIMPYTEQLVHLRAPCASSMILRRCSCLIIDDQLERQKREAEAAKRLKEEEEEWGKSNENRKAEGKEVQTFEDWRKEKKGGWGSVICVVPSSTLCQATEWCSEYDVCW